MKDCFSRICLTTKVYTLGLMAPNTKESFSKGLEQVKVICLQLMDASIMENSSTKKLKAYVKSLPLILVHTEDILKMEKKTAEES